MVEDNNICCVCGCEVRRRVGGVPVYFCHNCFTEHREAIITNAPWVRYLLNQEKQRRKRRNRLLAAMVRLRPLYYLEKGASYA